MIRFAWGREMRHWLRLARKQLLFSLGASACLCLVVGCGAASTTDPDKPMLRLEGNQDVQVSDGKRSATVVLQVINDSPRRVALNEVISTTCGCTSAELKKLVLDPQESTDLTVNVRYNGSVVQQVEAVVTESESNFQLRVPLLVLYPGVFAATPNRLHLSRTEGDPEDLTSRVTICLDTALEDSLKVQSIPEFISSARIVKTELSDLVLVTTIPPSLGAHSQQGTIVLTAGDDKRLEIPVSLDHEPLVSITPQTIDFSSKPSHGLVVRTARGAKIDSISPSDSFSISHETIGKAAQTHLIRIEKRDSTLLVPQSILVKCRMLPDDTIVTKEIKLCW